MRESAGVSRMSSGARLGRLGERFQVLCITHLPQIAARASTHFHIDKTVRGNRTVTSVQQLGEASRVDEIGRMIGGAVLTDQVRASARELLGAAAAGSPGQAKGKQKAKGESESLRAADAAPDTGSMAKRYLIETFGCQMNVHDSERMAGCSSRPAMKRRRAMPTPTSS
jgi:hypothetical protein